MGCMAFLVGSKTRSQSQAVSPERIAHPKGEIKTENDMLMLSAGSAFDLSRRLGERENEIQVFLCCFL